MTATPKTVSAALSGHGIHLIDAASIAPGVVRLTVSPGQARAAANAMIMAGFDAARSGDQTVTVTSN